MALTLILAVGTQTLGCASPEQKFRVLSFFFDGVPPPVKKEAMSLSGPEGEATPEEIEAPVGSVHGPAAKRGECAPCHDQNRGMRLAMDKREMCQACHSPDNFTGPVVHGPVAAMQCQVCHDPHKSPYPHLLREKGSAICGHCHDPQAFEESNRHFAEYGEECLDCHAPHAAQKPYLLK